MNLFIRSCFVVLVLAELASCAVGNGHICGPQTPVFYCDKEAYNKIMHPKTFGEHWIMDGMTKERWQLDWVSCGGLSDGTYASDAPGGSTTEVLQAASRRASRELGACMEQKGYKYQVDVGTPTPVKN